MPRPPKVRRVEHVPEITYFKPQGVPLRDLEIIIISFEEMEAVRLKDQEGLDQQQAAERMGISRPTFQRILTTARARIAEALTGGKAIRIEGGSFRVCRKRHRHGGPPR